VSKLKQLFKMMVGMLLVCSGTGLQAQNQPQGTAAGRISETVRTVSYPEAIYGHGILPDVDRGFVIHHEIEINQNPDTAMVKMYDATGKRIREGRVWPQGAGGVRIRRTAATKDGAILAAGGAILKDGSTPGYIAKTDLAGTTVQSLLTGSFKPEQICEAPDGTIWSLGKSVSPNDGQEHDTNVLRHFSFEKGLLHSFLPETSVSAAVGSSRPWFVPFGSFLRCGKDKVSVYLEFTDEYAEVSLATLELTRWKLDIAPEWHGNAEGFAVTEDGRVYASFSNIILDGSHRLTGLYQVWARPGVPNAQLVPVAGTVNISEKYKTLPTGSFIYVWCADGDQLIVKRVDERDLSWVDVVGAGAPE
jgi:hypothetical protein